MAGKDVTPLNYGPNTIDNYGGRPPAIRKVAVKEKPPCSQPQK